MKLDEPTIDLVHLARQTDGDTALEAELLALFDRQSTVLVGQLAVENSTFAARADMAHKLRGSALAIGAGRVASTAQTLEALLQSITADPQQRGRALESLASAVAETHGVIAELLR